MSTENLRNKIVYLCKINNNIVEAIRLEFQPEIKEQILNLLSTFSSDELKIVEENNFVDPNLLKIKENLKLQHLK